MTMLQFLPTMAWLQTYVWTVQLVTPMSSTASITEGMTATLPLTQAMWIHWKGLKWSLPWFSANNSPGSIHQYGGQALAQAAAKRITNHEQMALGNTETKKQWGQM